MSSVLDCCTPCGTVQITQVPGNEGPAGTDGTDGVSAYTITTDDLLIVVSPAVTTIGVLSSVWLVIGQVLIIGAGISDLTVGGPAHFVVTDIPSSTSVTLEYLGSVGDVAPGETILAGATVSPSAA